MYKVGRRIEGGEEDDGYVGCLRILLEFDGSVETADVGHHHVEQDKIGMLLLTYLYATCTIVGGENLEFLVGQQYLKQQHVAHHVIYYQYAIVAPVDTLLKCFSVFHN